MIQSVWSYRTFVRGLVLQEFRDRSARTLWGHAWVVIEPAVQVVIYVVIFSSVLQARLPGTKVIPPLSFFPSFLALKLLGTERYAHIQEHAFDPGPGLFAQLNVLLWMAVEKWRGWRSKSVTPG